MQVLWKYWSRTEPVIYYSWERWNYSDRRGFTEYRFPPAEDDEDERY